MRLPLLANSFDHLNAFVGSLVRNDTVEFFGVPIHCHYDCFPGMVKTKEHPRDASRNAVQAVAEI
jgi:hypothetical protein